MAPAGDPSLPTAASSADEAALAGVSPEAALSPEVEAVPELFEDVAPAL
jgi:hypothetical protein